MSFRGLIAVCLAATAALGQTRLSKEDSFVLHLARTSANIAANTQHQKMAGYLAVYVDEKGWEKLTRDSDLGPFLRLKEPRPDLSMVLLLPASEPEAVRVAVYFDGPDPVGMITSHDRIDPASVKPVPKDALKEIDVEQGLMFTRGEVASDDGDPIVAYEISGPDPLKK